MPSPLSLSEKGAGEGHCLDNTTLEACQPAFCNKSTALVLVLVLALVLELVLVLVLVLVKCCTVVAKCELVRLKCCNIETAPLPGSSLQGREWRGHELSPLLCR